MTFCLTIYRNTLNSAQAIVLQMRNMNVECTFAEHIIKYRIENTPDFVFSIDIAQGIHELWQDPIIPKVMDCSSQFYLMDSASYFFMEVLHIGTPDYTPTENNTTGITKTQFNMGQLSIHMFDVGGQCLERNKWIHCFKSITTSEETIHE
ncbi:guanine nucleotide binding protein, alpha subunit [Suillus placidus]|uniref:Guanine nucleotide binding protein, alpha subunit n=1 Tax=Suillus placidus TaxID=48579 RepID=A0A9P7CWF9_9AGAM|nr:guanine nucleotide binding protein, alpha subunit [Suillus placidus]